MKVSLNPRKSVEENAAEYFERSKKAKRKIEGAKKALEETRKKLSRIDELIKKEQEIQDRPERKKEWYEKFRWFYTSDDMLFIAGRDATTNEIIVKKHTEKNDLVFHSEMAGSPFGALKTEGRIPGEKAVRECSQFIACYSKAWKGGSTITDVFYVNPDQVTKEAPSGEYIGKGSFMIYGKKNIVTAELKLFIGKTNDGKIMPGPESAVKKHCKEYIQIRQGDEKTSSLAKKLRAILNSDDLDDIIKVIPVGSALMQKR